MRPKHLAIALLSTCVSVTIAELILRATEYQPPSVQHRLCNCSYLYEPVTNTAETNELGLRAAGPMALQAEEGITRYVFLGDSVVWGTGVTRAETFVSRFEQYVQSDSARKVEAVNGGVEGFSPYNEYYYLRDKLSQVHLDAVVMTLCLNDISDPRLHWNATGQVSPPVPDEAIPNTEYDRTVVLPRLERDRFSWWRHFSLTKRMHLALFGKELVLPQEVIGGKVWPTHITGEDSLSIRIYADQKSPEWAWLRTWIRMVRREAEQRRASFHLLISPLAYQLSPDYPIHLGSIFQQFCQEEGLHCVDLLNALRTSKAPFLKRNGDIWHLSVEGHDAVGRYLSQHLTAADARNAPSS